MGDRFIYLYTYTLLTLVFLIGSSSWSAVALSPVAVAAAVALTSDVSDDVMLASTHPHEDLPPQKYILARSETNGVNSAGTKAKLSIYLPGFERL